MAQEAHKIVQDARTDPHGCWVTPASQQPFVLAIKTAPNSEGIAIGFLLLHTNIQEYSK